MHFSGFSLLPLLALADVALSVCPGYNYGISNAVDVNNVKIWSVYEDNCIVADYLTSKDGNVNPCTSGMFGCSPPPIHFNKYTNSHTGLIYDCRPDPNAGRCGNYDIAVCCRNDGH
ncbi:hypothetical protein BDN72DRAFT_806416 [Pluteus cervinus]|uniref:Uncharacterized protein n=1 Tax=Pluteus cervinus TaxID=181527 RepID=A0ACD2ZZ46_9AGAR|nr:hypothetical protein BDN72DRAFT_806416 [Pluteus cervinus]